MKARTASVERRTSAREPDEESQSPEGMVSWLTRNCKRPANVPPRDKIEGPAEEAGYAGHAICTPKDPLNYELVRSIK